MGKVHEIPEIPYFFSTMVALGGLLVAADLHPMLALPSGGLSAALIYSLGKKTSPLVASVLGVITAFFTLLLARFGWTFLVSLPSLVIGCLWLILPQKGWGGDDRLYLPPLLIALGIGIMYYIRTHLPGDPEDLLTMSGLPGIMEWINRVVMEGADQITGEAREQYLAMMRQFRKNFPYYYIGGQLTAFSLVMNFILRLQRSRRDPVQPLLLFKIKERYVLLLIFAMGIEIFRYLYDRKELLYVSRSFLVFLGVTYFLAGLAVLGYLVLMRRLKMNSFLSRWLILILGFLIIIKPVICAAIGLMDIWFDFRRLNKFKGGFIS